MRRWTCWATCWAAARPRGSIARWSARSRSRRRAGQSGRRGDDERVRHHGHVRPGHTIAEVEAAIAKEIERIKAEPPTAEEMDRAVNTFEARLIRSLESVGGSAAGPIS